MSTALQQLGELLADADAPEQPTPRPRREPRLLEPGLHRDVPMWEYLALPYMSASKLHRLHRSPKQFLHAQDAESEDTEATERGTALHMAVLESSLFDGHYTVAQPCGAVLKSGQRKGEPCGNPGLFLMRNGLGWLCGQHVRGFGSEIDTSREILSAENYASVIGMRDSIRAHHRSRSLFEGKGEFEATIVFDDPETGVRCRIRPDRLVERAGLLVDIKTTRTAHPHEFPRLAENLGYFHKMALYRRGLRALGWNYQASVVLAVEPTMPYDLAPSLIDEESLDSADADITRALRIYRQCEEADNWPGYASSEDGFLTLRRPAYATNREND